MAEYVGDGVLQEMERDVDFALGEVQDIRDTLDSAELVERLEGTEARLKELRDTLYAYLGEAPNNPAHAAVQARRRMFEAQFAE